MLKPRLSKKEISRMISLRQNGLSLFEIKAMVGHSKSTISKYVKGIKLLPSLKNTWNGEQEGSIRRSLRQWDESRSWAKNALSVSERDKLIILACLYWGEGTKKELNLINSDPNLIKVFVSCLMSLGVKKSDLRLTLRVYGDTHREGAVAFWSKLLGLPKYQIINVDVLEGRKLGRLEHGMCRVRVKKGAMYFKRIMSMIELVKLLP